MNLLDAKTKAKQKFSKIPGVNGIGIGYNTINIYVVNDSVRCHLPREFEGYKVEIIVTGDIMSA